MKMKLRYLIVPAAALAVLPFWLILNEPDSPTDLDPAEAEPEKREVEVISPISATTETASASKATPPPENADEPAPTVGSDLSAQKTETPLSSDIPPATQEAPVVPDIGEDEATEGKPMKMGVVKENAKLDPALAELAKEGVLAVTEERWSDARETYLELVKQAPDNALAYANLGVAEHQLGNLLAASGNLRKSLEINPGIAQNWQTLGVIHFEKGELEMAISTLTRAIHEDPSNARSRLYLATVIREYGWIDASITELERALATDPELAEAHFNLAVTYLEEKPPRLELAKRHYFSAVELGAEPSAELEAVFKKSEATKE